MLNNIIICVLINFIIVTIWDYLNAPNDILSQLFNHLTKGRITSITLVRPFGCSLCMTFWCSLVYTLIVMPFSFYCILIAFTLSIANAVMTKYMLYSINLATKLLTNCFILAERLIDKIR